MMLTVKISDKITKPDIFTITLLISDYDLACFLEKLKGFLTVIIPYLMVAVVVAV